LDIKRIKLGAIHESSWNKLESILEQRLPVQQSWQEFIDYLTGIITAEYWDKIKILNTKQEQEDVIEWIENLLKNTPPSENIIAIWIGISRLWDESIEEEIYGLSLKGSDSYDVDSVEWAYSSTYEPSDDYFIPDILKQIDYLINADKDNYPFLD
jgi:hypothetical protein